MTFKKFNYKQLQNLTETKSTIYNNNEEILAEENLIIVPHTSVRIDDKEETFVLLLNTKNGEKNIVCDFGDIYNFSSIDIFISLMINSKTMESFYIPPNYIKQNTSFYATVEIDHEGNEYLVSNCPIFAFVDIGPSNKDELNNLISLFIENYKIRLRKSNSNYDFMSVLVYMPILDFYYLTRGTTYNITDEENNKYEMDVKDGILYDEDLISLYSPKNGDIPMSAIYNNKSNFPFRIYNFSYVSSYIKKYMFPLLDDEELNVLGF